MPIPTGTVTFLFSDIEGSTRLWETYPQDMPQSFQQQESLFRQAMAAHGGYVYKMIGDAFQVAFSSASAALSAAIDAQQRLGAARWGVTGPIKMRMGLHTGVTEERGDDYLGPELNRAARITNAGHGGQILLSQATFELVQKHLPAGVSLRDLGEHWLKDLRQPEHIYQVEAPGLPTDFPPLRALDFLRGNLPRPAAAFYGRQRELAQIEAWLTSPDCRLVTLVGIGGSGKTRLAIQAAWQSQVFQNNACFIPLASVKSLDELLVATAQSIQFKFQVPAGQSLSPNMAKAQLIQYLSDKRALLILDNCEQLLEQAGFVDELLEAAPRLKVLATSRERLNLPGEWVIELTGLDYPEEGEPDQTLDYPAIQLFIQSAGRATGYRYNPFDWPAIARICRLVEGLPLGIEMASTWLRVFTCQEIAAEIEHDLDFLSATWRGVPERHQSLRAVFEYSWHLLTHTERENFMRLGIFQGSFERQAAQEIAGLPTVRLAALVDKSLVARSASPGRFEIHPLLARYAREKLHAHPSVLAEVQARYTAYYKAWFQKMTEALKGSQQFEALSALRGELLDLHAALNLLVDQNDLTGILDILPGLLLFNFMNEQQLVTRALTEWLHRLDQFLATSSCVEPGLGLLAAALSYFSAVHGSYQASIAYEKQCQSLIVAMPDDRSKALALLLLAMLNSRYPGAMSHDQEAAYALESRAIFNRLDDAWGVALVQVILGDIYTGGYNDFPTGRSYYQSSLEAFTRLENEWGRSICLTGLMWLASRVEEHEQVLTYGEQALEILRRMDNRERMVWVNDCLAETAWRLGKIERARQLYQENLAVFSELGNEAQKTVYQNKLISLSA